jgi:Acyl-CoA dehydrogenase, middle domain
MLRETCKGDQIKNDLMLYATGQKKLRTAITEAAAGSHAANMQMRAEYKNGEWVLNGQKIFIRHAQGSPDRVHRTRLPRISRFRMPQRSASLVYRARSVEEWVARD